MPRSALLSLSDIERNTEYLLRRTKGVTLEVYLEDPDLHYIVERIFTIVGEAMTVLRRDFPDVSSQFEEEAGVIAFRNFVVHSYWALDQIQVWSIVQDKVASLHEATIKLMTSLQANL